MEQQLTVSREKEFTYEILLREDFSGLPGALETAGLKGRRLCIVTDSQVGPLYEKEMARGLEEHGFSYTVFLFEAGEASKNLDTVQKLYEHLILHKYERKDCLIALGGGVVGDLTGFAAATYLRGIDFVQVPTTLLAQVDSSIGGKTGVDFWQYKNMIGAFHQPRLVYMNLSTLKSLSETEFACGMGEVLKSALIWDASYYEWLLQFADDIQKRKTPVLMEMIARCCNIKRQVVEADPKEQGLRAVLNFGHTIGHAVEKLMDFQLLHGQCVALGALAAACISKERQLLSEEEYADIKEGFLRFRLPVFLKEKLSEMEILQATKSDKKMEAGHIKFILLKKPGEAYIDTTVTDEELLAGIRCILQGGEDA